MSDTRLTPERLAMIRRGITDTRCDQPWTWARDLLAELDAVTEKLDGTRRWLSTVEGELRAASKDTSRLDWLQNDQGRHVYPSAHFEGRPWACGERAYVEIRSAIDDAMSWPIPILEREP
jgi:hypothetical protein